MKYDYEEQFTDALKSITDNNLKKKLVAIKKLVCERMSLEKDFKKEHNKLDYKYEQLYKPFYERRQKIIEGEEKPDFEKIREKLAELKINEEEAKKEKEDEKGIPEFWYKVLLNNQDIMLNERDKEVLKKLKLIKCTPEENGNFSLEFFFEPNDYFTNEVLKREFILDEDCDIKEIKSDEIQWKSDAMNTTIEIKQKKVKNKRTKQVKTITKKEKNDKKNSSDRESEIIEIQKSNEKDLLNSSEKKKNNEEIKNDEIKLMEIKTDEKKQEENEEAFSKIDNELIKSKQNFDTKKSGSTVCMGIINYKNLFMANIGDSRAILCSCNNNNWKSSQLTKDHKPKDKSEYKRILAAGGTVSRMINTEKNDEEIGPYRVWDKIQDKGPGLAMSRSIGDGQAKNLGVLNEPDIFEYVLNEGDKFIVCASDGVWEYLSNDDVMNIVKDVYIKEGKADEACEILVKKASDEWRKENNNTMDDISCAILFLNVK